MTKPLTFGSLFAGIGGFDLGFERAGMECKWQVEIDDYATRILEKHWPSVHRERDVRECGSCNLEYVDVICGGFPCQDICGCGSGEGLNGQRSGLWFEFERIIGEIRPRFVAIENASELVVRGLEAVLAGLAKNGFDAQWFNLSASRFGAPHSRCRTWIVAHAISERSSGPWQRIKPISPTSIPYREAGGLVDAFQGKALPYVCGRHDGLSDGMDRLTGLGNSVVPQAAEWIADLITEMNHR